MPELHTPVSSKTLGARFGTLDPSGAFFYSAQHSPQEFRSTQSQVDRCLMTWSPAAASPSAPLLASRATRRGDEGLTICSSNPNLSNDISCLIIDPVFIVKHRDVNQDLFEQEFAGRRPRNTRSVPSGVKGRSPSSSPCRSFRSPPPHLPRRHPFARQSQAPYHNTESPPPRDTTPPVSSHLSALIQRATLGPSTIGQGDHVEEEKRWAKRL